MPLSHSPRPQDWGCLDYLSLPMIPCDPGPQTPGGSSQGLSQAPCPKRETTVGKSHLREMAQEEIPVCRGSLCFASLSMG